MGTGKEAFEFLSKTLMRVTFLKMKLIDKFDLHVWPELRGG